MENTQEETYGLVRLWAAKRGIYDSGDPITQFAKLQEEQGELAKALLTEDIEEIVDAIGDSVVVLINLAELVNRKYSEHTGGECTLEFCVKAAYDQIKNRTGKMENGTFVKDK